jgi:hypothetical protein
MSKTSRQVRLFRPNLEKFTKELSSVESHAKNNTNESWIWPTDVTTVSSVRPSVIQEPLVYTYAPTKIKSSGSGYARWCILTAALSFQVHDAKLFLKHLSLWWGDGEHPINKIPTTDNEWRAIFLEDESFDARKQIFTEIMTSKYFQTIGLSWESKIATSRVFNQLDALQLAKLFRKSFSDPYLTKAQRAIWQFSVAFLRLGQNVVASLSPNASPLLVVDSPSIGIHPVAIEKLSSGDLYRDDSIESSIRSFIIMHPDLVNGSLSFEWPLLQENVSHTTDY